ncbi:hypothetical protein ccbrp13_26080 [Ktedonobacteria bacterium brp13]|nr:hypothetical protein ccbrp13_26080 [Ktedonobacteria bacterium brp13]
MLESLVPLFEGGDSFSYRGELSFTYAAHYHSTLNSTLVSLAYNRGVSVIASDFLPSASNAIPPQREWQWF